LVYKKAQHKSFTHKKQPLASQCCQYLLPSTGDTTYCPRTLNQNLYHLPGGVFVEIYFDTHVNQIVQLRSFTSAAPLENYTLRVRLPEDL
jgi:hypothetical protein